MTGRTMHVKYYLIVCDGCGATFGADSTNEPGAQRALAETEGWQLIPKLNRDGQPRKVNPNGRVTSSGSDVCPHCAPTWTPRPYYTNSIPAAWLNDPAELRRRADALEAEQTERTAAEAQTAAAIERAEDYRKAAGPWPDHLRDENGKAIPGERIHRSMTHPDIPDSRIVVHTEGSMESHRRSGWQTLTEAVTEP